MDKDKEREIFLPTYDKSLRRMRDEGLRLAYYTDVDTALKIIDGRSIWMRNTMYMNDVGELEYGRAAMDGLLADQTVRARMGEVLGPIHPGIVPALLQAWERLSPRLIGETYIACFTEHPPSENETGRLSMWRAYCSRPDGVALVLNTTAFMLETNEFNAYSSPVFYGNSAAQREKLLEVLQNVENHREGVAGFGPDGVLHRMVLAILFGAVCLKHPGFSEEAEWRVIFMPNAIAQRTRLKRIENVLSPPQAVWTIPLMNDADAGLRGLDPDELIDRVIVGPSSRTAEIISQLSAALERQGALNANARLVPSGIPLRPN